MVDFSDMFDARPREEINKCMFILMNAIKDFKVLELNLSDNDLGLSMEAVQDVIDSCHQHLKVLNLNNCQLGPDGIE